MRVYVTYYVSKCALCVLRLTLYLVLSYYSERYVKLCIFSFCCCVLQQSTFSDFYVNNNIKSAKTPENSINLRRSLMIFCVNKRPNLSNFFSFLLFLLLNGLYVNVLLLCVSGNYFAYVSIFLVSFKASSPDICAFPPHITVSVAQDGASRVKNSSDSDDVGIEYVEPDSASMIIDVDGD